LQRKFFQDIAHLALGSLLANLVWFGFSLWLPQLYGPAEFGRFGVFLSIANILAIVAALRYEVVIILPPEREAALQLLGWGVALILGFSLCAVAWGLAMPAWQPWRWPWLYATAALLALYACLHFFLLRESQLIAIGASKFVFALAASLSQLALAGIRPEDGLALGYLLGLLPANLFLLLRLRSYPWRSGLQYQAFRALAARYFSIVKYALPSQLLNALVSNLQPLLLLRFFGAAEAGFYFLAYRLAWAPLNLLTNAIAQAYYREMNQQLAKAPEQALPLTLKMLAGLALLVLLPFLGLLWWAPALFAAFFGPDWAMGGRFLQWMGALFVGKALFHPISFLAELLDITRLELALNLYLFAATLGALYLGWHYGRIDLFILGYSCSAGLGYGVFALLFLKRLRQRAAG
jgi:O-antigen/teichoic acid export membrane protein